MLQTRDVYRVIIVFLLQVKLVDNFCSNWHELTKSANRAKRLCKEWCLPGAEHKISLLLLYDRKLGMDGSGMWLVLVLITSSIKP